jgi:hypothetical protein
VRVILNTHARFSLPHGPGTAQEPTAMAEVRQLPKTCCGVFLESRRGDSNSRPLHYEGARGCSVESPLVLKHLANLHVFERRVPPPKTRSGNFMFLFCSVKPAGQSRGNRDPFENWQAWALQHWDVTHVVVGANARLALTLRLGPAASPTRLPGRA